MVGPSSGSSWQLYVTTIYLYIFWNHYYTINAVSSSEVVLLVHLRKAKHLLTLAVTQINISFDINIIDNKREASQLHFIQDVGMAFANKVGMMHAKVATLGKATHNLNLFHTTVRQYPETESVPIHVVINAVHKYLSFTH